MRSLGVVQAGDPLLARAARPFALPEEAPDARRVLAELRSVMERAARVHVFSKGIGIAAPQIGIDRAAALVRAPVGQPVSLLNPRAVEASGEADEQYEGCLSCFDVRGLVPRPLALHAEHEDLGGQRRITVFHRGMARLAAHEADHLHGVLYTARMRPGVAPIPIAEYQGTGQDWRHGPSS